MIISITLNIVAINEINMSKIQLMIPYRDSYY